MVTSMSSKGMLLGPKSPHTKNNSQCGTIVKDDVPITVKEWDEWDEFVEFKALPEETAKSKKMSNLAKRNK
uniref:Uncharacterized protein n=1 Tax=Oryza punctata TaxID=4537 RepID=A0A0E0L164_ORYPU